MTEFAVDEIPAGPAAPHRPRKALERLCEGLVLWRRKRLSRLRLAELDDAILRDIGVTPDEARREIGKSFRWPDPPSGGWR